VAGVITSPVLVRELRFSGEAATIDAVQRAAYKLSDQMSVDINVVRSEIVCALHLAINEQADETVAEFRNEVLDQVLRARIRDETEAARNLILSLAFSQTGLVPESK
jgi:His-Xaa-Ser system protein HxsD